jgi:hypothetical protein
MQPDATSGNLSFTAGESRRTNPIQCLSPRQLAAARELGRGRRVKDVSVDLKIHRVTLFRWQKLPAFREELRRLHRRMSRALVSRDASARSNRQRSSRALDQRPTAEQLSSKLGFDVPKGTMLEQILADADVHRRQMRMRIHQMRASRR